MRHGSGQVHDIELTAAETLIGDAQAIDGGRVLDRWTIHGRALVRRHPIQPSVTSAPEKKPVIETNHARVSHDAAYSLRRAIHALAERASGLASSWLRTTGTERPACDGRLANVTERPPPRLGGEPGSVVVDGDRPERRARGVPSARADRLPA